MKKLLITIFIIFLLISAVSYWAFKDTILDVSLQGANVLIAQIGDTAPYQQNEQPSKRTDSSITFYEGQKDEFHYNARSRFYAKPVFIQDGNEWKHIEYKTEPLWVFNLKEKTKVVLSNIAYAAIGTTKFAPTNGDGYVVYSSSATWATVHDAANGTSASYTFSSNVAASTGKIVSGNYTISRYYSPFNTSALPDNYTAISAKMCIYVTAKENGDNDGQDYINVYKTLQSSYSTLTVSDYSLSTKWATSTALATAIDIGSISTSAYNCWSLNSSGIAVISNTSTTPLGLLEGHDVENAAYAGANNTNNSITVRTVNYTGSTYDPYLEITYSPSIEWLKGYDDRIRFWINKTYRVDEYPFEISFATSSAKGGDDMRWFLDELESDKKNWVTQLKIQPAADDGITQMNGEIQAYSTTSDFYQLYAAKIGFGFTTSSNTSFYLYYDRRATSSAYVSAMSPLTGDRRSTWLGNFYQVYNFSQTTIDSVSPTDTTLTWTGDTDYVADSTGIPATAMYFSGDDYGQAATFGGTTDVAYGIMIDFMFPTDLTERSDPYCFFQKSIYVTAGNPLNRMTRVCYIHDGVSPKLELYNGSNTTTASINLADGLWHTIGVMHTGSISYLYLDKTSVGSSGSMAYTTPLSIVSRMIIGTDEDYPNHSFTGTMGRFWIIQDVTQLPDWFYAHYDNIKNDLFEIKPNYKMIHY